MTEVHKAPYRVGPGILDVAEPPGGVGLEQPEVVVVHSDNCIRLRQVSAVEKRGKPMMKSEV